MRSEPDRLLIPGKPVSERKQASIFEMLFRKERGKEMNYSSLDPRNLKGIEVI